MPKIIREALTKRAIESAAATGKLYRLRDNNPNGLVLRVSATGAKKWAVLWGRGQEMVIGEFPQTTLKEAQTLARETLSQIDKHGTPAAHPSRRQSGEVSTFADFLDDKYGPWVKAERKAGAATVSNLRAQFADFLNKPLAALTAWNIEKFKADRLRAGIAPATVNRDLARIRACIAKAVEWKVLAEHPLRGVKRAKGGDEGRIRYLSRDEEKALRKALDEREKAHRKRRLSGNAWRKERGRDALPALPAYCDHLAPMTILALNTGLRRGELTSLTWADINLERKLLTVRAGYAKSGKARHIPLNSEAVDVLKLYKKQHDGEGRLFAVQSIKKAWAALMVDAKLSDFRWHDLRHSFASNLVQAGVDLNTVRELLGHADIRMTLRYAHLAPEHKAAAVEKLVR